MLNLLNDNGLASCDYTTRFLYTPALMPREVREVPPKQWRDQDVDQTLDGGEESKEAEGLGETPSRGGREEVGGKVGEQGLELVAC